MIAPVKRVLSIFVHYSLCIIVMFLPRTLIPSYAIFAATPSLSRTCICELPSMLYERLKNREAEANRFGR